MPSRKQRRTLALLASLAVLRGAAAGERQISYLDDGAITVKVMTALHDENSLEASGLVVATEDGIVRLTGIASSRAQIERPPKWPARSAACSRSRTTSA